MIILEKCARSSRVNSRTARTQEARACSFSFQFRCGRYTYGGSEYASPGPGTGGSGYYNHQAMTNYELSADYVDSTTTYDPRPTQTQVADTVAPDTPSAVTATGVLPSVVTTGEYSLHETPSIPHHFFLSFFLSSAKQKPTTLLIYLSIFLSLSLSHTHSFVVRLSRKLEKAWLLHLVTLDAVWNFSNGWNCEPSLALRKKFADPVVRLVL